MYEANELLHGPTEYQATIKQMSHLSGLSGSSQNVTQHFSESAAHSESEEEEFDPNYDPDEELGDSII